MQIENQLAIFKGKQVRRVLFNNEWYFSFVDVCEILTDSPIPRNYWSILKSRLIDQKIQLHTICMQLKMVAEDGKLRETDCVSVENMFRIIQEIPSPKAEPFKRWLARVGFERVQEIENPELATKRTRTLYKLKGYSEDWIEKRMRGIAIREELTDEWKQRGANENTDYEILTAEISKATITGGARKQLEKKLGRSVVSKNNFKQIKESKTRKIK